MLRHKLLAILCGMVVYAGMPAAAQTVIATVPVGVEPWGIADNPVTQKVYVVNTCGSQCQGGPSVTVIDENTLATTTVPVGYSSNVEPPIAVNKTTNKIYVANACGNDLYCGSIGTVTVIDGATLATTTVQVGYRPEAIAINEVTNKIFVVNACGEAYCGLQSLSIIDGGTLSVTNVTTGYGFYNVAPSVAVNPVTNKVFVVNPCGSTMTGCYDTDGNVTEIDPVTLANTAITVGEYPNAIAVNSVTNKIYVANAEVYGVTPVTVIDGQTLSTTNVGLQQPVLRLEVNEVTNKIYAVCANPFPAPGQLAVIDGATLATYFYTLPPGPTGLAINSTTNKIYISN